MRQENVSHLQASYAQVARTFALFAERNWKLLDEWDSDLPNQFYDLTSEEAWSVIRDKAARWQYSELYMFNQNGEYSSVSGRHGISPHKESVFMAIYDENRPVLTSYPSTDGARKVVFAKPIRTPVLMESVCSVECNLVTTTREAAAFIQGVRRSNLHLVYDVYHEAMEGQSIDVIRDVADEIRVVHIAQDVNHGQRAYLDEEHLAAYRPYWDMLTRVGYQGEWNIESFVGNVEAGLKNSMTVIKRLRKGV